MGFFDLLKTKEKKQNNFSKAIKLEDIFIDMKHGVKCNIMPYQAYQAYNNISAVGDAVDIVAQNVASIKPIIVDKDGKLVNNPKVESVLYSPNTIESYKDFCLNLVINYLLNNNAYIEVMGNVKSKPLGLYNVANTMLSVVENPNEICYIVTSTGFYEFLSGSFVLDHKSGRAMAKGIHENLKELYHIKGFTQSNNSIEGKSKLNSIFNDLEVIDNITKEIVSKHRDGFNSGHIITVDTNDQDGFNEFVKAAKNKFFGPRSKGQPMFTMGKSVDIKTIEQTSRDMQSIENKKDSRNVTYDRFGIPIALRDQSSQTYNNYQTALYSLYDNTVLPLSQKIYTTLEKIFKDRNILAEDHSITYDENLIPALQLRRNQELSALSDIGVLSTNELRTRANYESIGEAGDTIYIEGSRVPLGSDQDTDDNIQKRKESFYLDLKKQNFSDSEITEFWNEYLQIQ